MSLRRRREREGMSRCEQNISRRAPDGTDCTTYEKRKKKKKKKKTCEYTCSSPPQFYHIMYEGTYEVEPDRSSSGLPGQARVQADEPCTYFF
eukprot:31427-Pelagococcus_subviridis.AAC.5